MSGIEAKIYETLTGSTTLTGYVGSAIYPEHRYQDDETPAVVYWRSPGGLRINDLKGYSGKENPIIEITVYSSAVDLRRDISQAVIDAMTESTRITCLLPDPPFDDYDDITKTYERTMQFSAWYQAT
jgi:hypothetical protein